jgi:hypothetical protein
MDEPTSPMIEDAARRPLVKNRTWLVVVVLLIVVAIAAVIILYQVPPPRH